MGSMVTTCFDLDDTRAAILECLAREHGVSQSEIVWKAIDALAEVETLERSRDEAFESLTATFEPAHGLELPGSGGPPE